MRKQSKLIVAVLIIMLLGLLACSQEAKTIDKQALLTQLNLGENTEVIESKEVDVTGDGTKDNIVLVGSRLAEDESPFRDDLMIVVQESKSQEYLRATYENFAGYEPELMIKEFTGDNIADVMVTANSGGSGGIYHHLIASFKDGRAKVIFDQNNNKGIKVSGQFIPNFKAKLEFVDLNKKAVLDISANKKEYVKLKIYNQNGALVKRSLIRPYTNPFSKLEPVDYNNDGKYELKGIQRVVGANNADKISELESIWSYRKGKWNLIEATYNTLLVK
jgi:hypothetical protein